MPPAFAAPLSPGNDLSADLDRVLAEVGALRAAAARDPLIGRRGVGVPAADRLLVDCSRRLRPRQGETEGPGPGPDLFLATQIYKDGGHTGLLGDMARALAAEPGRPAPSARLLVTNTHGHHPRAPGPAHLDRLGPLAGEMAVLRNGTPAEKLGELLGTVRALRPRRIFLFHHPDDALPVIAAAAADGPERIVVVHHADAVPSLGLHVPGSILIDLNPTAAAFSRAWGLSPALLPMTAPDPGPRPRGFLARGRPVTATCARSPKLRSDDPVRYTAMVPELLAATAGWHVHIGTLDDDLLAEIRRGLAERGLAPDRLIYHPHAPSLARALHEHDVDVYVSSYPIDGARTHVEVAAAGLPFLAHVPPGKRSLAGGFPMEGRMEWTGWEDLRGRLREITGAGFLEAMSVRSRASYRRLHHPAVFAEHLAAILTGGPGWVDPDAAAREAEARERLRGGASEPSD